MAKGKSTAEDEMPMEVSGEALIPENTAAAIAGQSAQVAPSMDDVLAYWAPGREKTMEVPGLIKQYSVKCEECDAMLPYIPVREQEAPKLICSTHSA